jgi:hypothetical protein
VTVGDGLSVVPAMAVSSRHTIQLAWLRVAREQQEQQAAVPTSSNVWQMFARANSSGMSPNPVKHSQWQAMPVGSGLDIAVSCVVCYPAEHTVAHALHAAHRCSAWCTAAHCLLTGTAEDTKAVLLAHQEAPNTPVGLPLSTLWTPQHCPAASSPAGAPQHRHKPCRAHHLPARRCLSRHRHHKRRHKPAAAEIRGAATRKRKQIPGAPVASP